MFRMQRLTFQSLRRCCKRNITNVKFTGRYMSTSMQESEGSALQKAFLNAVKPTNSSSETEKVADKSSSSSSSTSTTTEGADSVNTSSHSKPFFPDLKTQSKSDEKHGKSTELSTDEKMDLNPIQRNTTKYASSSEISGSASAPAPSSVYSFQSPLVTTTTPPASFTPPAVMEATQGHLHEFAPKIIVFGVGGGIVDVLGGEVVVVGM